MAVDFSQDEADTLRSYASSLPDDERSSFVTKFQSLSPAGQRTALERISGTQNNAKDQIISGAVLGGAGAAAAAGAGYLANKHVVQPWKQLSGANKDLTAIGQQFGVDPRTAPGFVPKALTDKLQLTRALNQSSLQDVRSKTQGGIRGLTKQLSNLDTNDVTNASTELANHIKTNIPDVYKKTMENYGAGLDAADAAAHDAGFTMSNKQFVSNVLDNVIEEAQRTGIDPKEIERLNGAKEGLMAQSKILDAGGNPVGSNLSLSEAKGVVSNLTRTDPYSPLSAKIRENWATFLEKEAPDAVKPIYAKLNASYKPFSEARALLTKLSDPKTGEFDSAGLSKYIKGYVQKNGDTGINKLMSLLGEGNDLVPKVDAISQQFSKVSDLRDTRGQLIKALRDAQSAAPGAINDVHQANLGKVQALLEGRAKANTLSTIADDAATKLNPLKALGKTLLGKTRLLASGLPAGVVQGELMKRGGGYDPMEALDTLYKVKFGSPRDKQAVADKFKEALAAYNSSLMI